MASPTHMCRFMARMRGQDMRLHRSRWRSRADAAILAPYTEPVWHPGEAVLLHLATLRFRNSHGTLASKPGSANSSREQIVPVDATASGICCLPVGQFFHEVQYGNHSQALRGLNCSARVSERVRQTTDPGR